MNKTKIEWVRNPDGSQGFTSNPIKGLCPVGCSYCYARGFYRRFKLNPKIRLDEKELLAPSKRKKPARIFVGSTIEMYHPNIPCTWINKILDVSYEACYHSYFTLTKMPENIVKNRIKFPHWWWVGITITGKESYIEQKNLMANLGWIDSEHRFISFEPLLQRISFAFKRGISLIGIDGIIIGGQSGRKKFYPPENWIRQIESEADKLGIPICEKDNLRKAWKRPPRREFPKWHSET